MTTSSSGSSSRETKSLNVMAVAPPATAARSRPSSPSAAQSMAEAATTGAANAAAVAASAANATADGMLCNYKALLDVDSSTLPYTACVPTSRVARLSSFRSTSSSSRNLNAGVEENGYYVSYVGGGRMRRSGSSGKFKEENGGSKRRLKASVPRIFVRNSPARQPQIFGEQNTRGSDIGNNASNDGGTALPRMHGESDHATHRTHHVMRSLISPTTDETEDASTAGTSSHPALQYYPQYTSSAATTNDGENLLFDRYGFVIGRLRNGDKDSLAGDVPPQPQGPPISDSRLEEEEHALTTLPSTSHFLHKHHTMSVVGILLNGKNKNTRRVKERRSKSLQRRSSSPRRSRRREDSPMVRQRRGASIPEEEQKRRFELEQKREKKWTKMMDKWSTLHFDDVKKAKKNRRNAKEQQQQSNEDHHESNVTTKNRTLLKRRIRKGIPNAYRGTAWVMLSNVPSKIRYNPGRYQELVRATVGESHDSRDTIERDIHRTFPRHLMFLEEQKSSLSAGKANSGCIESTASEVGGPALELISCGRNQVMDGINATRENWNLGAKLGVPLVDDDESLLRDNGSTDDDGGVCNSIYQNEKGGQAMLRRVLNAYSIYDKDVGYCQGMNFIAATFITYMPEEEAFWLLVVTMNDMPCKMRGLFGEGMLQAQQILYVAEKLIGLYLPAVSKHFQKEMIHVTMFATQWLLTVYTSSFPFDLVARVWDCFIAEGWKIAYRVMLALLKISSSDLLNLHFEEILAYFARLPSRVDGPAVMDEAFSIALKSRHIEKFEKEWIAKEAKDAKPS